MLVVLTLRGNVCLVCCDSIGVLATGDFDHLSLQLLNYVLKFLSKEDQVRLVVCVVDVIIGLVGLVKLVMTHHFAT